MNMEELVVKVEEKDDCFWERQTLKELGSLRSGIMGTKTTLCLWSILCIIDGLYLWLVVDVLRDPTKSTYVKIFEVFSTLVLAFGNTCFLVMPFRDHVRLKFLAEARDGVLSRSAHKVHQDLLDSLLSNIEEGEA